MSTVPTPTAAEIVATTLASAWLSGTSKTRLDVFAADLREHVAALAVGLKPDAGTDCPQVTALAVLQSFLSVLEAKRAA